MNSHERPSRIGHASFVPKKRFLRLIATLKFSEFVFFDDLSAFFMGLARGTSALFPV